ncbi:hypothetical protein AAY473_008300 [Plecturocebus cupreus]
MSHGAVAHACNPSTLGGGGTAPLPEPIFAVPAMRLRMRRTGFQPAGRSPGPLGTWRGRT